MRKNSVILLLVCLFICHFGANAQSEGNLRANVQTLCGDIMQGRGRGYRGHAIAEQLICENFAKAGLSAIGGSYFKDFSLGKHNGIKGRNIIGVLENPGTTKYIVVCAYYDSIGILNGRYYAGADANASGVAAMLEVISSLRPSALDCGAFGFSIIFAAFDCHLDGYLGAQALWQDIENGRMVMPGGRALKKDDIGLMVDFDQLGNSLNPGESGREDYLFAIGENSLWGSCKGLLDACNEEFGLEIRRNYLDSALMTKLICPMGERGIFTEKGVPVLLFSAGITDHNNKTSDTPGTINFPVLARRTALLTDFLATLSGAETFHAQRL